MRAENPGKATIAGADLSGTDLTLAQLRRRRRESRSSPARARSRSLHNRISGGYFGVDAGPTTTTSITDTTIRGNKFVGPFGEDAIRLNRYHDSDDPDPYGVLIEGNEITDVRENGNHSDCLQSVWGGDGLYFRRNYLHDNRCQGFFVKDQAERRRLRTGRRDRSKNNLMLRNAAPCDPPTSGCGPPLIVQIFGPTEGIRISHNTIWTAGRRLARRPARRPLRPDRRSRDNVLYRGWSDWSGGFPHFTETGNVVCRWEGPARG